jgi:hypothetical protein
MHASVIEYTLKPGVRDEANALTEELIEELSSRVQGLRAFFNMDRGGDKGMAIAIYENEADWAAAAPVAEEVLGKLGPYMAAMPERAGCDITFLKRFVTD